MKNIQDIQNWRADQIVKLFVLNSGILSIAENYLNIDDKLDYIGIYKDNPQIKFGIGIKATKYTQSEINKKYTITQANIELPIIYFFIDYDKEAGFFRLTNNRTYTSTLIQMEKEKFNFEINKYINTYYR
jgi:hypothetical protein